MTGSDKPRSALADAADRLGQLARTAREQQLAERGAVRLSASEVYSTSPDEVWAKRFMSQGIGPTPDCTQPGGYCPLPFSFAEQVAAPPARQAASVAIETSVSPAAQGFSQIGQAIGMPLRRSFLSRVLRRSP